MNTRIRRGLARGVPIVPGCVALLTSWCPPVHADPGDLDVSFGGFGNGG